MIILRATERCRRRTGLLKVDNLSSFFYIKIIKQELTVLLKASAPLPSEKHVYLFADFIA